MAINILDQPTNLVNFVDNFIAYKIENTNGNKTMANIEINGGPTIEVIQGKPDDDNQIVFQEIGRILRPFIEFQLPVFDGNNTENLLANFSIEFEDGIDNAIAPVRYTLRGSLNYIDFKLINYFDNTNFLILLGDTPNIRPVRSGQKEWWSVITNLASNFDYEILVTRLTDFSTETISLGLLSPYNLHIFDISYDYLVAQLPASWLDGVESYRVLIRNTVGSVQTTEIQYNLDLSYRRWERYYLYENSVGGFSVLPCFGERTDEDNVDRSITQKFVPYDYSISDGQEKVYNSNSQITFEQSTGYLELSPVELLELYDEFLESENVYEIDTDNNELIPIVLTSTRKTSKKDNKDIIAFVFEARYAFQRKIN